MTRFQRLIALSFTESFATVMVERGLYFYTREILHYTDVQNLWLALGYGASYVVGAQLSHRLSRVAGERALLLGLLAIHVALHVLIPAVYLHPPFFVAANLALALATGTKWPLIESYVSAGLAPEQTARAVGLFNISWAAAAPLAMVAAGPIITQGPRGLFLIPAAVNILSLAIFWPLEPRPVHLAHDHPDQLDPESFACLKTLLTSSRWSMFASYTILFILAPLAPGIFERLGVPTAWGTACWGLVEVVRAATFIVLLLTDRWHGKTKLLLAVILGLPAGCFMVLLADHLPIAPAFALRVALAGELIFGVAAGLAYYSALYYAMVVQNASVDAGGDHESLVGGGFCLGPALGLASLYLAGPLGGPMAGIFVGIGPVIAFCAAAALRPLLKRSD